MATKQSADLVLKLLNKIPDGDKVSTLLEPNNLLKLLQIYGQSQDDIRQRLTSGTLPGELLLELLEREPDPDRLLAQLGISASPSKPKVIKQEPMPQADEPVLPGTTTSKPKVVSQAESPKSRESVPPKTTSARSKNLFGNNFLIAVLVIIGLTAITPALMVTGFFSVMLSRETGTLIALIGGAVAGAIADPNARFSWKGMLVGIVYGVGTLWATILYTQARTSIIKIEIVIPLLLGAIPACAVYYVLSKVFPGKKKESGTPCQNVSS